MRSGYLILLAAALGVSAEPAAKWGVCDEDLGKCPSGFKCDPCNDQYSQCIPESYPSTLPKRDAGIDANATPGAPPSAGIQKRQAPASIPVRGAQSTNGACYHRYKIQTLQTSHADQFNMLIAALEDLQTQPESGDLSWFGIGGIHGAPYISWPRGTTGSFNQGLGYCVHGGPLFATWHRPYTLLLEQALQARAVAIAARFTGTRAQAYRTAADQLRLPYWDWSDSSSPGLPPITMQASISVTKPSSSGAPVSSTIQNPLFRYTFQSQATLRQYFSGNYANWMYTTRHPRSSSDPTPNNGDANTIMTNGYTTRRGQTYSMFSFTSFNSMANQLEGIHNQVHTNLGGSDVLGHMSVTNVASFDPIFWLHHCNVDRMVALYQAIYPANRLQPSPGRATFGRIVPGVDGPNDDLFTNLYPFRLPSGSWWQSNEIKSVGTIWKYKFGYDEIPCSMLNSATGDQVSAFTREKVNALYAPSSSGGSKKTRRSAAPNASPEALALADPKRFPFQPGYTPGLKVPTTARNDYGIRCSIDNSEIPGSWVAHILFTPQPCGKVSPREYILSPDRIAGFASFGTPLKRMESMIYSQEYPITDNLIDRKVNIKSVSAVENWLKDNLKVCFTTAGDDTLYEVPASSLKTWKIGVYRQATTYPDGLKFGSILPSYGEKQYLPKVTRGMPGGVTSKSEMEYPTLLDGRVEDLLGDRETY